MRSAWVRTAPVIELSATELHESVAAAFPGQYAVDHELITGGLSNTNYRVVLSRDQRSVRLRLYQRAGAALHEHALESLIPERVPHPRFLYVNATAAVPFAFLEWIDGQPLERVLDALAPSEAQDLAADIGRVLARIHSRRFDRTGFFDERGEIAHSFDANSEGLRGFARAALFDGPGRQRLGAAFAEQFYRWLDSAALLLDQVNGVACLSHSDFGGSNIIVAPSSGSYKVAGVVDWEYACSGIPYFDLGNLLRPPNSDRPDFADAVARGYAAGGGSLPDAWLELARVADMFAMLEMVTRPGVPDAMMVAVRAWMERVMRSSPTP